MFDPPARDALFAVAGMTDYSVSSLPGMLSIQEYMAVVGLKASVVASPHDATRNASDTENQHQPSDLCRKLHVMIPNGTLMGGDNANTDRWNSKS